MGADLVATEYVERYGNELLTELMEEHEIEVADGIVAEEDRWDDEGGRVDSPHEEEE